MKPSQILSVLVVLSVTAACGLEVDEEEEEASVQSEELVKKGNHRCSSGERSEAESENVRAKSNAAREGSGSIDVYVHVIHGGDGAGDVSDAAIRAQIDVLDRSFRGSGFGFRLKSVDRTANVAWAADTMKHDKPMMRALHRGTVRDLNVYTTPGISFLGIANFPDHIPKDDKRLDGVIILNSSVPGGVAPYDRGLTLVHEVGHWLGLEHTFKGGCKGKNDDFVSDTPKENGMHFGCERGRDSCKKDPGKDPVANFMSYSDDACLTEFTPDQKRRMRKLWTTFRAK